jgi:hypothetical protein
VVAFKRGRTIAVAVLYGEDSDWVRNVLAGGGQVVRAGRTYELLEPRLVSRSDGTVLPAAARILARVVDKVLVAEVGAPALGFGRGPRASS